MPACWEKPEEDRTFHRKDALKQHLKRVHGFNCEPTAEDGHTLDLLGMHRYQEGLDGALQRNSAQIFKAKAACSEWASREHSLSGEMFEPCWVEALAKAFGRASNAVSPVDGGVVDYCVRRLRDVMADVEDAG
jgi:hypothetical protein